MGGYGRRPGGLHKVKQHMVALRFETHAKLKRITRERRMSMDQVIAEMLDRAEKAKTA